MKKESLLFTHKGAAILAASAVLCAVAQPKAAIGQPVGSVRKTDIFFRVEAAVNAIRVIDTHEHLRSEEDWMSLDDPAYWFGGYLGNDLRSAGMTGAIGNSPSEQWAAIKPYWEMVRFGGYAQAIRLAARDLHGVPEINEETWPILAKRIKASKRPGYYEHVLRERGGIELCILDVLKGADPDLTSDRPAWCRQVQRFDDYMQLTPERLQRISARHGRPIRTVEDLLAALDNEFEDIVARGFVGIKCGVAYERILRFEDEPRPAAERVFKMLFSSGLSEEQRRPFEDFMMSQIVQRAGKHKLPVQIHTGLHAGRNYIKNSNPAHLTSLFLQHRNTRIVLLHGGFPYMGELTAVVKSLPNVYADLCWMPIIAPTSTKLWLHQWLDAAPVNKIFAFGGDTQTPEESYGHCVLTRRILAEVLAEKVLAGRFSESDASFIAKRMLRENAIEFYGLQRFLENP